MECRIDSLLGYMFSMCKLLIPTSVQITAAQTVHHIVAGMCMFDNEETLYFSYALLELQLLEHRTSKFVKLISHLLYLAVEHLPLILK